MIWSLRYLIWASFFGSSPADRLKKNSDSDKFDRRENQIPVQNFETLGVFERGRDRSVDDFRDFSSLARLHSDGLRIAARFPLPRNKLEHRRTMRDHSLELQIFDEPGSSSRLTSPTRCAANIKRSLFVSRTLADARNELLSSSLDTQTREGMLTFVTRLKMLIFRRFLRSFQSKRNLLKDANFLSLPIIPSHFPTKKLHFVLQLPDKLLR